MDFYDTLDKVQDLLTQACCLKFSIVTVSFSQEGASYAT